MSAQDQTGREQADDPWHGAFDVALPTWQRLDRNSSWIELAKGASSDACVSRVQAFNPQVCLCVDWTAVPAYLALQQRLPTAAPVGTRQSALPGVYLNFRVFASSFPATAESAGAPSVVDPVTLLLQGTSGSGTGTGTGSTTAAGPLTQGEVYARLDALQAAVAPSVLPDDRLFYCLLEGASMRACAGGGGGGTIALCRSDALVLLALACGVDFAPQAAKDGEEKVYSPLWGESCGASAAAHAFAADMSRGMGGGTAPGGTKLRIVMPPLRQDILATASALLQNQPAPASTATPPRYAVPGHLPGHSFLSSVARLSTEKGGHRLGPLLAAIQESEPGLLAQLKLQPLLVGAGPEKAYTDIVLRGVEAACGGQAINATVTGTGAPSPAATGSIPAPLNVSTYVGNSELASIYSDSSVNIHPALADAYGMTVVEGSSFGVPSVLCVPGIGQVYDRVLKGGGGEVHGTAVGSASGRAPQGLFTYFPDCESPGYMKVDVGALLHLGVGVGVPTLPTPANGREAAVRLASAGLNLVPSLPPVGCCDLLCSDPAAALLSGTAAVVPVDFHAPPAQQAQQLLPWLRTLLEERTSSSSSSAFSLRAAGKRAQARALAWSEHDNGRALLHTIHQALGQ